LESHTYFKIISYRLHGFPRVSLYVEAARLLHISTNRTSNMKSKKTPMFSFIYEGETVAVIQASSKEEARARIDLVRHIVPIPKSCKVKRRHPKTIYRAPVFFEGHFRAIEDAFSEAGV